MQEHFLQFSIAKVFFIPKKKSSIRAPDGFSYANLHIFHNIPCIFLKISIYFQLLPIGNLFFFQFSMKRSSRTSAQYSCNICNRGKLKEKKYCAICELCYYACKILKKNCFKQIDKRCLTCNFRRQIAIPYSAALANFRAAQCLTRHHIAFDRTHKRALSLLMHQFNNFAT